MNADANSDTDMPMEIENNGTGAAREYPHKYTKNMQLVHGFLRTTNSERSLSFPTDVSDVILYFYHFEPITFNTQKHGRCVFHSKTEVELISISTAVADYVISAADYNTFAWSVKLSTVGCYSYLGFVKAPLTVSMVHGFHRILAFDESVDQFAVQIWSEWNYVKRFDNTTTSTSDERYYLPTELRSIMDADILTFVVNFREQNCAVYINEFLVAANFFTNFGNAIIPAVGNSGRRAVYEIQTLTPVK